MTHRVGIRLEAGLVFLSDSRTDAGLDQISSFRKIAVYERPGDRAPRLLSAGQTPWPLRVESARHEPLRRVHGPDEGRP